MRLSKRHLVGAIACLAMTGVGAIALSASPALDALTSRDAAGGLRAALAQGIDTAVAQLGAPDGFLKNPKVTIPLPPALQRAERAMRMIGMGRDADNLKVAMNHAAEAAVAEAKPVFKDALQRMTVADARPSSRAVTMPARSIFAAPPTTSSSASSSPSSRAKPQS
jgi:hypothetical protein